MSISVVRPLEAASERAARALARRLRSDDEVIAAASELAVEFAQDAARRDRERILPWDELDRCSGAGIWAMNVPKTFGGAGVSYATVGRVFAIIAAADPSIAQIQQNHNSAVFWIEKTGTPEQRDFFLAEILSGKRLGNASADAGGRKAGTSSARITANADGFIVNGRKAYATGALFADYVTMPGLGDDGKMWVAVIPAGTPGLTIIDDWHSFGQRTTASGSVIIDNVALPARNILPIHRSYDSWPQGAVSQISHVGIDVGIARASINDTIAFIRSQSSAPLGGSVGKASEDPHLIFQVGQLEIRLHAAEAMTDRAGWAIDAAIREPNVDAIAAASIAVAEAKALATEIAIEASNKFFELAGTRSAVGQQAYDRHWRNARVHTLHDPVRWKYAAVGDYYLNGIKPQGTGQI
jgi:SfnB family sulfur acquisition oxidoreductase